MNRTHCVAHLLAVSLMLAGLSFAWSQPPDSSASSGAATQGASAAQQAKGKVTARRWLPDYEADVYGPLPFSEEVTGFLEHELTYILSRQNANGSWDSAQPTGKGRAKMEAGNTVDNITLTSMCAYSLRQYTEHGPDAFEAAIARALRFVTYMISSGKLRNNRQDAPWHYIYALRFLVHEYPKVKDPTIEKRVEDACAFIVRELKDMQHGTRGQRSVRFRWNRRSSPGLVVADTEDGPGVVVRCNAETPAFAAGVRVGDRLLTANEDLVNSAVRYAMAELDWSGGDTVEFQVLRGKDVRVFRVKLPGQYPGTLGLKVREAPEGVSLTGFDFLSNRDLAPLQPGDRILAANGRKIAKKTDLDGLALHAGQKIELLVQRGEKSHRFDYICAPVPAADFGISISRGYDQGARDGIAIAQFLGGSCLRAAGLNEGDRLLRLDGALILNRRHFANLSRSLSSGKKVRVTYLSGEKRKEVEVTAGALPNEKWLRGYHGLKIAARSPAVVESVDYGSPAEKAGCKPGDRIGEINGMPIESGRQAGALLSGVASGKRVDLVALRAGAKRRMTFVTNRTTDSVWVSRTRYSGGGWGYLTGVKGSNTFTTSDALRELLKAKRAMPRLDIPEEMLSRAFRMLSLLRKKQPNSDVESYRYDAAGSFWGVKDIRADVGRLNSAELACLMYCDTDMKKDGPARTQKHLEKTLREWLKHRGILDLVKFPKDHGKLGIAPWFWMYAYRTTLEAADYLTINDGLREDVRRNALKAFFMHMEFRYEEKLGAKGWIIGGDLDKELHDSCQLLDGLATMSHLYRPRIEVKHRALQEAMKKFHATRYGDAYVLIQALAGKGKAPEPGLATDMKLVRDAIQDRFASRLNDVQAIKRENPYDAMHHLKLMKPHFQGYPGLADAEKLLSAWKKQYGEEDKRPPSPLEKVLALRAAEPLPAKWGRGSRYLLKSVDPARNAIRGRWTRSDGQLISTRTPNARVQLAATAEGSYQLETQFTRMEGDCMAVMLPVGRTGVLLVISGWGGKVSGLAFVNGKDANRNTTTRDGALKNRVKHTLLITTRLLGGDRARIDVTLDGKPYVKWEGPRSALSPDREWRLRDRKAFGLGAYNAIIVFHSCQLKMLNGQTRTVR